MRIVVVHNFYQQPGGEDGVFAAEVELLRRFGHEVTPFTAHNDQLHHMNRLGSLAATIWNRQSHRALRTVLRQHQPQVVHFHNTFPLISPSAYAAARDEGAAVVQTLHNFRLLCPNALLFRDGHVCEDCLGRIVAWPGVMRRCYRGSRSATAAVAGMVATHKVLGTWQHAVDLYIALTESARQKFLQGGLPADRIVVKPNFLDPDPAPGTGSGDYAVFVGRLSHEKGVETLLAAWRTLGDTIRLKIIGDGPLAPRVREAVESCRGIEWLGRRPPAEVYDLIGEAAMLILPSGCYENFPRAIVEAYAKGTPVVASRLGAMADLIDPGRTGLLFDPGDADGLAAQVGSLLQTPDRLAMMRRAARCEYESHYTGPRNHELLMRLYWRAMESGNIPSAEDQEAAPVPGRLA